MDSAFCKKCGWCHFEVSREHVETWMKDWAQYCQEWPEDKLALYGIKDRKPPSPQQYYECFRCGNDYKNFQDTGKCPNGSTIQPILGRQYERVSSRECDK